MIQVTTTQSKQRWDSLSQDIRDALFSDEITEIIERILTAEHLIEPKQAIASKIIRYVFFGFLHPEDLPKELSEALGINIEIGKTITEQLKQRVFAPYINEVSNIYSPPGKEKVTGSASFAPELSKLMGGGEPPLKIRMESLLEKKAPVASGEPVIAGTTPLPQKTISSTPSVPSTPAVPAPFILHSETAAVPTPHAQQFHLEVSSKPTAGPSGNVKDEHKEASMRSFFGKPAQIEVGGMKSAASAAPKPADAERVVHYNDLRTPLPQSVAPMPKISIPTPSSPASQPIKPAAQIPVAAFSSKPTTLSVPAIPTRTTLSEVGKSPISPVKPMPAFVPAKEVATTRTVPMPPKPRVAQMRAADPAITKDIFPHAPIKDYMPKEGLTARLLERLEEKELPPGEKELNLPKNNS